MVMELSKKRVSPRVNLRFNEPWNGDVFALGFNKPVELHRGLPRAGLAFCEPVKFAKSRPWVWRVFGE